MLSDIKKVTERHRGPTEEEGESTKEACHAAISVERTSVDRVMV